MVACLLVAGCHSGDQATGAANQLKAAETPASGRDAPASPEAHKPDSVAAEPAPAIKGLKLNATQADVLALFPEGKCEKSATEPAETVCTVFHVSYGGSESGVIFVSIANGGAKVIQVAMLDTDKFDYMITGMVTKFGAPREPSSPAQLTYSTEVVWAGDGWMLGAERQPKGLHYPQVTLVDKRWADSKMDARAAEAARGL
jgi:hypothetical protein